MIRNVHIRSNLQNRLYRKLLRKMSASTGYSPDVWHEYFKEQYLKGGTSRIPLNKWNDYYLEVEAFCAHQGVILEDM